MEEKVPKPTSKFLEIECPQCKEKTIIFNKTSTLIKCGNCGEEIVIPTGGKGYIRGRILKVLD